MSHGSTASAGAEDADATPVWSAEPADAVEVTEVDGDEVSSNTKESVIMDVSEVTIPDTVLTAHLEGEAVLLDMVSKNYFRLNDTAALIWKALERRATTTEIVTDLRDTFEIDQDEATAAIERLLTELTSAGLLKAATP